MDGKHTMIGKQVKLPVHIEREISDHCKKESADRGQFYSVSRFLREAALDKLAREKKGGRVERKG